MNIRLSAWDGPSDDVSERRRFFRENGWIKVEGVISPDEAAELRTELERLRDAKQSNPDAHVKDLAENDYQRLATAVNEPSRFSDRMRDFATSERVGGLMREVTGLASLRVYRDLGLFKAPASDGGLGTGVHQDLPFYPVDRAGGAAIWFALTDLPADSGTLRFISGSHRWGPVGRYVLPGRDWLATHPEDAELLTAPPAMQAGDVTIHDNLMLHGTDQNTSDQVRIGYTVACVPGNAKFTGMPARQTDGLSLEVDEELDHKFFPMLR